MIAAMAVGVFAGVFSIAAMNSSVLQRIEAAVDHELSHIQVNNRDFRKSSDILDFIPRGDSLVTLLKAFPGVEQVTGRIIIRGMASTAAKSTGVEINGINVEQEKALFTLSGQLITGTGSYFSADTKYNSVFIGEKLAKELNIIRYTLTSKALLLLENRKVPPSVTEKLKSLEGQRFVSDRKFTRVLQSLLTAAEFDRFGYPVKEAAWSFREGSKLILTFVDIHGMQTGAAFRVCGIYRTNNDLFESTQLFVPDGELRTLTGIPEGSFHRIICRLESDKLTARITPVLKASLPGLEVLNWKEISPDLALMADMMQQMYGMFMAIILLALAFGIVNTMLMSVLERTKELGMLTAIGMNRRKIFRMIMLESLFLSVVGGLAGMGVAALVIAATARNGINLLKYSEGMEAMGFSAHLYPSIDPLFFIITTLLIILTGILSSVYPARKALRMNPVDAIRTD